MQLLRITAILLVGLFPRISLAEGFVTIDGKLGSGNEVIVDMETSSVWLWHRSSKGEITQARELKNQGCQLPGFVARPHA